MMIEPHGGKLVNRVLQGDALKDARARAESLPRLTVNFDTARDAQNIARGVFSPLEGFIGSADLASIVAGYRLVSGVAFPIPIMLDVATQDAVPVGDVVLYQEGKDEPLALYHVEEVYPWDKEKTAQAVFGTTEVEHPGVRGLYERGDFLVGGTIDLMDNDRGPYAEWNLFPAETRRVFEDRGWKTVVAFQTRNVPHAGHEDLQKTVLGLCDGLLIQPLIGKKKPGDFKDEVILEAYKVLVEKYFPQERVLLNILPTEMRYGGPKEAILHAIMRKNYGCTHIVIGRDHAGVSRKDKTPYYGEEEAIEFFANFPDLGIEPIMIRGDFWYCKKCNRVASNRNCPHGEDCQIPFSGTIIRRGISEGEPVPEEVMRPEVIEVIRRFEKPFVE
ncbi:MAG: sulfate adenylyltransferase [Armatimonadia bacterium]